MKGNVLIISYQLAINISIKSCISTSLVSYIGYSLTNTRLVILYLMEQSVMTVMNVIATSMSYLDDYSVSLVHSCQINIKVTYIIRSTHLHINNPDTD